MVTLLARVCRGYFPVRFSRLRVGVVCKVSRERNSELTLQRIKSEHRAGQALIEASLLVPLVFFLFLGLTNFGFYVYAFITVGNAARTAAQRTANSSFRNNQAVACEVVLREMRTLSNVSALDASYNCNAVAPVQVTMGSPSSPGKNYCEPTANTLASRVNVSYQTIQLFPLPFMDGRMTIHRTAVMRVMDSHPQICSGDPPV